MYNKLKPSQKAGGGRIPVSKHQVQPGYVVENELADTGRDGRTHISSGTGKETFPVFSADHEQHD